MDSHIVKVSTLKQSDIMKCPHYIMVPEHYRADRTCRCDDPSHEEMIDWEYTWKEGRWQ